jgi:hypothetical protein
VQPGAAHGPRQQGPLQEPQHTLPVLQQQQVPPQGLQQSTLLQQQQQQQRVLAGAVSRLPRPGSASQRGFLIGGGRGSSLLRPQGPGVPRASHPQPTGKASHLVKHDRAGIDPRRLVGMVGTLVCVGPGCVSLGT